MLASAKPLRISFEAVRPVIERLGGTIASNVLALANGAELFRVHDVREVREALIVAEAVLGWRDWGVDERFATSDAAR